MCSIRRATCNMSLNSSRYWTNGRFLGFDQYGNSKAEHFEIAIISWSIAPNPYVMSSTNLSPSFTKQKIHLFQPNQHNSLVVLLKYIKTGNRKIDHHFKNLYDIYIYIYPINDISKNKSQKKTQFRPPSRNKRHWGRWFLWYCWFIINFQLYMTSFCRNCSLQKCHRASTIIFP